MITTEIQVKTKQRNELVDITPQVENIVEESGIDADTAKRLVRLGQMTRNLREKGLDEGASTRLLINAAKLIKSGIKRREACKAAITDTLSDDDEMKAAMHEIVLSLF